jgi:hypothetical protein
MTTTHPAGACFSLANLKGEAGNWASPRPLCLAPNTTVTGAAASPGRGTIAGSAWSYIRSLPLAAAEGNRTRGQEKVEEYPTEREAGSAEGHCPGSSADLAIGICEEQRSLIEIERISGTALASEGVHVPACAVVVE